MENEWMIARAQNLLKSAEGLEDLTAKAALIDTAADLMQRAMPQPETAVEDDDD